jgi:hypothetical protein
VSATDAASGLTTTTTFAQAYPYTGRPTLVTRKRNNFDLSSTSTQYCDSLVESNGLLQCTPVSGPADGAPYPRPGRSLFVYASKVSDLVNVWRAPQLNAGFEQNITFTDFRYDQYGNPVRTTVTMISGREDEEIQNEDHREHLRSAWQPDARMGRVSRSVVTTRRTQPVDGNNVPIVHATEYEYDFGIVRALRSRRR